LTTCKSLEAVMQLQLVIRRRKRYRLMGTVVRAKQHLMGTVAKGARVRREACHSRQLLVPKLLVPKLLVLNLLVLKLRVLKLLVLKLLVLKLLVRWVALLPRTHDCDGAAQLGLLSGLRSAPSLLRQSRQSSVLAAPSHSCFPPAALRVQRMLRLLRQWLQWRPTELARQQTASR
jgi:hypothetical protein